MASSAGQGGSESDRGKAARAADVGAPPALITLARPLSPTTAVTNNHGGATLAPIVAGPTAAIVASCNPTYCEGAGDGSSSGRPGHLYDNHHRRLCQQHKDHRFRLPRGTGDENVRCPYRQQEIIVARVKRGRPRSSTASAAAASSGRIDTGAQQQQVSRHSPKCRAMGPAADGSCGCSGHGPLQDDDDVPLAVKLGKYFLV
ncbi:hypothetical protein EV182_001307 [Spiromyces aspiralis]|uniref:Uncharacterized protein n=1 Tax=Spiromyces aspiralis TaxID=68401 RepID=A0ACC1HWT4_9FUNG|nr:hypothetical protein EV182_001307 [Spiromyces aspiralis]